MLHNQGKVPTFDCNRGKSIIDITLSNRLPLKIENWRVNRKFNGSDHNTIMYQLVTDLVEIPAHRNYDKADWSKFADDLKKVSIYTPEVLNQKKLDAMVQKISYSIETITEAVSYTHVTLPTIYSV